MNRGHLFIAIILIPISASAAGAVTIGEGIAAARSALSDNAASFTGSSDGINPAVVFVRGGHGFGRHNNPSESLDDWIGRLNKKIACHSGYLKSGEYAPGCGGLGPNPPHWGGGGHHHGEGEALRDLHPSKQQVEQRLQELLQALAEARAEKARQ